ncbi:thioesterase-like superfamily-domain-containing protein [Phlebopus sp. FC_14]|nr:thioesterase-like superfamily-domain-containing protein [Phlebopus sp. FC_14]
MTALAKALEVGLQSKCDDGSCVYACELDRTWTIGAVPQGGYSLGVLVEACTKHMSESPHMDPIHVSAHFLHATNVGRGQVHVKIVKTGSIFTNLVANLVQQGQTKTVAHLIFGNLSPQPPGEGRKIFSPTSPYARRLPLTIHPGSIAPSFSRPDWTSEHVQFSLDDELLARNDLESPTRTSSKSDRVKVFALPFFADSFVPMPMLLPESEPANKGAPYSWYPTITMSVEFKARLPSSEKYSDRTVGIYCESRFLHEPHARHNARVELWTAPSVTGGGEPAEGWRERQYCLAIADQMCLMLPMEINTRKGSRDSTKLSGSKL